jgi:hypothetical protein
MSTFSTPVDVINRALQHCRQPRIATVSDHSEQAEETVFMYDKLREAELSTNLWRFATKRVILRPLGIDTVTWVPVVWVATNNYSPGAVVSFVPGSGVYLGQTVYWQTSKAKTGSATAITPEADPDWTKFFGLLTVDLYDTGTQGTGTISYQTGEIVLVPAVYAGGTTYALNAVVSSSTTWYVSLTAGNVGNAVTDLVHWTPWTSRGRGMDSYGVTASNSPIPLTYPTGWKVYISLFSNNQDNPVSATGNWLDLAAASISPLQIMWPLGSGPWYNLSTSNVFALPNGFLKKAPTSPKDGQAPYLGAFSGTAPEDWVMEDRYIVSRGLGPMMMRFIADVIDVTEMDATFCELVAASLAIDAVPSFKTLDPKLLPTLLSDTKRRYREERRVAVISNAIEIGPIAQVENRYVTVRA